MTNADEPAEVGEPGKEPKKTKTSWADFLARLPPPSRVIVEDGAEWRKNGFWYLQLPNLSLECETQACGGNRLFAPTESHTTLTDALERHYLVFRCRNCGISVKTYAVMVSLIRMKGDSIPPDMKLDCEATKVGEWPPFGPPVPSRVISLIGPDRALFLQGRKCENQALGIGAFSYYRRVVENQKNRLLDNIIRVGQKTPTPPEVIELLEAAKNETQFSRAMDSVKDAIPPVLRINGHNPLTLLHTALSQGLHAQSDEECLEIASSIRVVLTELAERMSQVLKDHAELNSAVSRLLKPPSTGGAD